MDIIMETNNASQKLFLKPRPFATLALIGVTTFAFMFSSCDNASKNNAKTDSLATKTEEKAAEKSMEKEVEKSTEKIAEKSTETTTKKEGNVEGNTLDVTFLRATWYAGSTKYYFKNAKANAKGEEIEVSLLNDPIEAGDYNPKMPKESLLEGDDPKREGPPSEEPKMVGKKFKIIYDSKDKEKVIEIRKDF